MKKILLILMLFILSGVCFAQDKLPEKPIAFRDKKGNLYWNKNVPIFLWLSPENKEFYRLNSKQEMAVPFYFDTEGINYIRSRWLVDTLGNYVTPKQEIKFPVYADSKAPVTRAKFIAEQSYTFKGKTYYSDDLQVELSATDALSGVRKIMFSVDSSGFLNYGNAIHLGASNDFTFQFYSVDNVGNVEEISDLSYTADKNNLLFAVDGEAPVTTIIDPRLTYSPFDSIILDAIDSGVGVYATIYRFDTLEYKKFSGEIRFSELADGIHDLEFYSVDRINNTEQTNSFSFYYDALPPQIEIREDFVDSVSHIRIIEVFATDNYSGVESIRIIFGEDEFDYVEPFLLDIEQDLKIEVIDSVGNRSIRIIRNSFH